MKFKVLFRGARWMVDFEPSGCRAASDVEVAQAERIRVLEEALRNYGRHVSDCASRAYRREEDCNCGYGAALKEQP